MLLEQQYINLFKVLHGWVMSYDGSENKIAKLEQAIESGNFQEDMAEWNITGVKSLIEREPKFSSVDMKELFWVSRDNIIDAMSGTTLIPVRVKRLFNDSYNAASDNILKPLCEGQVKQLSAEDLRDYYSLLEEKTLSNPNDKRCYHIYYFCIVCEVEQAYQRFLGILRRIDTQSIPFSLGNKFNDIVEKYNQDGELLKLINSNKQLMKSIKTAK